MNRFGWLLWLLLAALLCGQDKIEDRLGRAVDQANRKAAKDIAKARQKAQGAGEKLDAYCKSKNMRATATRPGDYVWGCVSVPPIPPPTTTK
jgi:hypothetical protein